MMSTVTPGDEDQFPKFTPSCPLICPLILLVEDEEHDEEAKNNDDR